MAFLDLSEHLLMLSDIDGSAGRPLLPLPTYVRWHAGSCVATHLSMSDGPSWLCVASRLWGPHDAYCVMSVSCMACPRALFPSLPSRPLRFGHGRFILACLSGIYFSAFSADFVAIFWKFCFGWIFSVVCVIDWMFIFLIWREDCWMWWECLLGCISLSTFVNMFVGTLCMSFLTNTLDFCVTYNGLISLMRLYNLKFLVSKFCLHSSSFVMKYGIGFWSLVF